ncbi:MAG: NAD(P)-dependent alcohol dehydrogenase [Pirellulales bacterium]
MTAVTAAVVRAPGGPWSLETLELDEPRDDEVLVRIVGVGICHTDLSIRDQFLPLRLPIVLGHEGAGVVERVGAKVTGLETGDHVVLAPLCCGACGNCQSGLQVYCEQFLPLNIGLRRADGSATFRGDAKVHGAFFGQSSFATMALAHQRNAIKVPRDVPLELLGPLGCGIQAGAGTVFNALRPRAGASLAVFGTGAVGLSAIMAARLAGCTTIIAVDVVDPRLQLARELGATHSVNNSTGDLVDLVQRATAGRGVDYSIDTTAVPAVIRQAFDCLATPGTCAVLGLARHGAEVAFDINSLGNGRTVRGVTEGESVPKTFIPSLIELWRQGRFPFDRLVRKYALTDINQAAADMQRGDAIKPVLLMP